MAVYHVTYHVIKCDSHVINFVWVGHLNACLASLVSHSPMSLDLRLFPLLHLPHYPRHSLDPGIMYID